VCGICGVVQIGGEEPRRFDPEVLDWMTDLMTHRGPDDRGTLLDPGCALGARRLSIVDVAGGRQPLSNEDGSVWAAQNGELYNHLDLRKTLAADGHVFRSRCDTEILPHLYERFGTEFPEHLRGKFAVAVWDRRRRRAVLARDRMGVKPLYYAVAGDQLVFASELKSVLASGLVGAELDYEAIDAYLTLSFFPGPRTPLAGVSKLGPGERLVVDDAGVRVESYWRFPRPVERPSVRFSEQEHAEQLLEVLEDAVRSRLMSDVPLGAMLSGGLDSSLIVALMARNMTEPVKTFSIGFREAGDANELADARLVANALGTEHHEVELSFLDDAVSLEELVWHVDEPLANISSLGFLALSGVAAREVTVALSGQGADELLGGYERYRSAMVADRWQRLPRSLRLPVEAAAAVGPRRLRRAARIASAPSVCARIAERSDWTTLAPHLALEPLSAYGGHAAEEAAATLVDGFTGSSAATSMYLDARLGLVDDMLHYFDRASMARALEVRVPFLDHHVVEHCAGIPLDLKVRGGTGKYLLKRAARGLVPDRIIDKHKLGFFSPVVGLWVREQLSGAAATYLLGGRPRYAEMLDRGLVEQLAVSNAEGTDRRHAQFLLAVLMLEVWLSSYLPRALATPRAAAAAAG